MDTFRDITLNIIMFVGFLCVISTLILWISSLVHGFVYGRQKIMKIRKMVNEIDLSNTVIINKDGKILHSYTSDWDKAIVSIDKAISEVEKCLKSR